MRVLLIGGSGFIGPHVARALLGSGHDVAVFHRGRAPKIAGTRQILGDRNRLGESATALRAFAPQVVVDLVLSSAAQARQLVETFRDVASRIVAISSMDVYRAAGVLHRLEAGELQPLPLTEDSELRRVRHPYPPPVLARAKAAFSWLDDDYDKIPVEEVVMSAPVPGTVLRLPMVYGPGDPLHRFFPIVKRMLDGRKQIILAESVAAWRGTKGYVEDVAAAIALAAGDERAAGRVFNVGEETALTELEWAERIGAVMHWQGEFVVLPDERTPRHLHFPGNAAQHWVASAQRFRDELGFREPIHRDEALRRTVAWDRAHAPVHVDPAQFDYATEDAALAAR